MQLIPTTWAQNLCLTQNAASSSLLLSLYSSYSHNKTYWVVAKDQDTPGSGTRKKSRVTFPKEKVRSPMGSTENSYEMLHTRLKYKLQSLICTARVRSREALRWTVSPPSKVITDNTEYMKLELQSSGCHIKTSPSLMRSCQQGHTDAVIWGTWVPCQMSDLLSALIQGVFPLSLVFFNKCSMTDSLLELFAQSLQPRARKK